MQVKLIAVTQPAPGFPVEPLVSGAEQVMAYQARVSSDNQDNPNYGKLFNYCVKHGHWSVFEMADMSVEVVTSRAVSAQVMRHRSFSFQEMSQRYAPVSGWEPCEARRQDTKNRQNSIDDLDDNVKDWWEQTQKDQWHWTERQYKKALQFGIAKECARMILPIGVQTKFYMKGSVRSWIHYLQVRAAPETQLEHRQVALAIMPIFCETFPTVAQALSLSPAGINQD